MSSKVKKPLSPAELEQYEVGRDLAADLLLFPFTQIVFGNIEQVVI